MACNGCTRTDPRARKPQPKRAALPSAPAYSLDPEERKQRTKRDIIEGRNKKGEPADKVPPPSPLSLQSPMPDADTRRRLPLSPAGVWSRPAEAKDRGQAQNGQGQDRGGLPAALQRTLLPLFCFSQRHRHHHRLTRLVTKLQEKHRPESLVSQHAKSVNEKKLEKVPFSSFFIYMMMMMDHQHTFPLFCLLSLRRRRLRRRRTRSGSRGTETRWDRASSRPRLAPASCARPRISTPASRPSPATDSSKHSNFSLETTSLAFSAPSVMVSCVVCACAVVCVCAVLCVLFPYPERSCAEKERAKLRESCPLVALHVPCPNNAETNNSTPSFRCRSAPQASAAHPHLQVSSPLRLQQ